MADVTPEDRARAAARALTAEGSPVTSRAIRDRAKVRMAVAAQVAREANESVAAAAQTPDLPDQVTDQVAALWRAAVEAAKEKHAAEMASAAQRLAEAQTERDDAVQLVIELEEKLAVAKDALARAQAAETRATAAEARADGLREALAALASGQDR